MRLLACAALVAALVLAPTAAPAAAKPSVYIARAADALDALQRRLLDRRSNTYREGMQSSVRAHAWPASQAVSATIVTAKARPTPASTRAARNALRRLERFRRGALYAAWPGGDVYYDDNEWIARVDLDAGELWRRPSAVAAARRIFAGVVRVWDNEPSHPCSGGIRWTNAAGNSDRNTVTTANGAVIALRLYAATNRRSYLTWSRRMLDWLDRCMLAPEGLYWDHVDDSGAVDRTEWSYNQGSVIEANVLLHAATQDPNALVRAEQLADATLEAFDARWSNGEPPEFAAVFFRSVLHLAAVDGRKRYVDAADAYGAWLWARRNPHTGLVTFGGRTRLLDQAAAVQVYAALARAGR